MSGPGDGPDGGEDLWSFAVRVYAVPGVSEACLRLQDDHGVDVPVVLFAAWTTTVAGETPPDLITEALALTEQWRRAVVEPLRAVRRHLREPREGISAAGQAQLRAAVAEVELSAERLQLGALEYLVDGNAARAGLVAQRPEVFIAMITRWNEHAALGLGEAAAVESLVEILVAAASDLSREAARGALAAALNGARGQSPGS